MPALFPPAERRGQAVGRAQRQGSIVSEGDSPPPELGKTLASAIHRFRQRWLRPQASTTLVRGSWPMRQVPKTWVALKVS